MVFVNIQQDLCKIAKNIIMEKGLEPEFPKEVIRALESINAPAAISGDIRDLRSLAWCSIDNDDFRDLYPFKFKSWLFCAPKSRD